ncbi:hypothetical protein Tco_0607742, partial [Tanacetum coccineum]
DRSCGWTSYYQVSTSGFSYSENTWSLGPDGEAVKGYLAAKSLVLFLNLNSTARIKTLVEVSQILGFPSISLGPVGGPKWDPCQARVRFLLAQLSSLFLLLILAVDSEVMATYIRCVLTQKPLDAFYDKFHIPEEVHPVLPNQNDTMHKRPAGKIGLYTRFFDYVNFRLPLSAFLVDVLRHFRINISQLSVIGAAKVSHFEILCRVYGIIPTVRLFRCFYVNSKKNGWMSFSKRSDNAPKWIFCFLHALDPTKIKIVEREWNEGEQTTIGRIVPLLSVAPDRAESELEASVDMLFDEGGSGNQTEQGDSAGGGEGADV